MKHFETHMLYLLMPSHLPLTSHTLYLLMLPHLPLTS